MKQLNIICRDDVQVKNNKLPCVAVDAGLLYAIEHDLDIVQIIGDFDSLPNKEYLSYNDRLIKAEVEKDKSDLQLAIEYLSDFNGQINVYGALGKRMDHSLVNLKICYYSDLDIHLIDENNEIFRLEPGRHTISNKEYKYISFLSFDDCRITLKNFKYPLTEYLLEKNDNLTLSNELTSASGEVVNDSKLLVFLTND